MYEDYELILLQKGLNVSHKNIMREKHFLQDLFHYIVQIFCVQLKKTDCIMALFAQVNDVPLVSYVKVTIFLNCVVVFQSTFNFYYLRYALLSKSIKGFFFQIPMRIFTLIFN